MAAPRNATHNQSVSAFLGWLARQLNFTATFLYHDMWLAVQTQVSGTEMVLGGRRARYTSGADQLLLQLPPGGTSGRLVHALPGFTQAQNSAVQTVTAAGEPLGCRQDASSVTPSCLSSLLFLRPRYDEGQAFTQNQPYFGSCPVWRILYHLLDYCGASWLGSVLNHCCENVKFMQPL